MDLQNGNGRVEVEGVARKAGHYVGTSARTGGQHVGTTVLLTEPEAALVLSVSRTTVRKLRGQGLLPYQRFGRALRYRLADIEDFIERSTQRQPLAGGAGPATRQAAFRPLTEAAREQADRILARVREKDRRVNAG